jgi:hypothetical protein
VEGHSSRLEQVEDKILGLEDKVDIREKNRTFSQKTQELCKNSATSSKDQTIES